MKYLFFICLLACLSCANNEAQENQTAISTNLLILDKDQFNKKLAETQTVQLIDVRTPEEYVAGSIPNSLNIDFYSDDFEKRMKALDKERPVFVYCKSGGRSGKTAKKLQKGGFKEVYDLKGGYTNWSK